MAKTRRRGRRRLSPSQREAVGRLKSTLGRLGHERGNTAEDLTERALVYLFECNILRFERSEHSDERDRQGIDFEVWGLNPFKAHFAIDVKSSYARALEVNALGRSHHWGLHVRVGEYRRETVLKILEILIREAELIQ